LCLHGRDYAFWTEYQYGYFYVRENELTEWAIMPFPEITHYRYSEPWPAMKWELGDEQQTICGYQCQKATCHWRGRDFAAWFTPKIPIKSGPWKFGGLPGLIMKVFDSRRLYLWEAVAVEKGSFPIYQPDEHMYKKSTRQKVWKMQSEWNKRHNELAGVLDFNFRPKTKRYPYDPLELE
jgi:GLPGLI family protein